MLLIYISKVGLFRQLGIARVRNGCIEIVVGC